MAIQQIPAAAATGYLSFGVGVPSGKYGTPSNTDRRTDVVVTGDVPAGSYVAYYKAATTSRLIYGTEELDMGTASPQTINISTAQSSWTYRSQGSWTETITPVNLTTKMNGVAYGNGYYVIIGAQTNEGCVSTNGATWSTVLGIGTTTSANQKELSFVNGFFIVNGPTGGATNLMISTNATTWTSRLVTTSVTPIGPWGYATVQGLYWNHFLNGGIVVSSNLSTFTTRAVFAGSGTGSNANVFYANPWWIMVSSNGYFTSTDGTNWTTRNILPGFSPLCAAFGNGRVVVNFNGTTTTAVSTDTINWTTGAFTWTSATNQQNMTFGNGYFVSSGPGLNSTTGIFTSTNGLNWVERHSSVNNTQTNLIWGSSGGYITFREYQNGTATYNRVLQVGGLVPSNAILLVGGRTDTATYPTV